jgi:hypothetical protein
MSPPLCGSKRTVLQAGLSNDNADRGTGKRCNGCRATKPRSAFSLDKSKRDGLQSRCKACNAAYLDTKEGRLRNLVGQSKHSHGERTDKGRALGVYTWTYEQALCGLAVVQMGEDYWFPEHVLTFAAGGSWLISPDRLDAAGATYTWRNIVLTSQEFQSRRTWSKLKIDHMTDLVNMPIDPQHTTLTYWQAYFAKAAHKKPAPPCRDATHVRTKRGTRCLTCSNTYLAAFRRTPYGFLQQLVANTRGNSKANGHAAISTLTMSPVIEVIACQHGRCQISRGVDGVRPGIPLVFCPDSDWQASIERLNPKLPYTVDNCVVTCVEFNSGCNRMK